MRLKKLFTVIIIFGHLSGICTPQAEAATQTAPLVVTATVLAVCAIAVTPLSFGNYSAAVLNIPATLSVTCTSTTPYNVGLNAGTSTGATVTTRRMTNGANTLQYTLSSDAAHSVNIGQTIGTDTIAGTGNGSVQTITIYGQILANQYVVPGVYSDTVTATITY
jgi:spore coat protein U-like protein